MHVTTFGVILFLHIATAIAAFMIAAVLHSSLHAVARAETGAHAGSWSRLTHRLEPMLPIAALLLLGFGAWMIHLRSARLSWSDSWILVSVIALVVVEGASGVLLAPRSKRLVKGVHAAGEGPLADDVKRLARDPILWHFAHVASFGFLGVVFLMAAKPDGVWSVVIVVVAALIGVAVSAAQLRALPAVGIAQAQRQSASA